MKEYMEKADIETASDDYATRFSGGVGEFFLDVQLQKVEKILQSYRSPSILDVGGGHAQLAIPMIKKGLKVTVTGSDDSCESRLAHAFPQGGYVYETCDMLNLPFEDSSFDLVMAFRLLPHVANWQKLCGELCRVARRGIIVDYPDWRSSNILQGLLFHVKKSLEGNTRTFKLFTRKQIAGEFGLHNCRVADFDPEFFLPMVVHRKIGSSTFSNLSETCLSSIGLTHFFGSPIVAHIRKEGGK